MDPLRLDALARVLSVPDSRRRVLGLLTAAPVVGGLLSILSHEETEAAGRRKRRKKAHKHGEGRRRKHRKHKKKKPQCTSNSVAQTCAGTCGSVTNNCRQAVDCGSCTCDPTCAACFTCQDGPNTPGTCVVDPDQVGSACGTSGQICQANGTCACTATSCPACTTCGGDGQCAACADCCNGDGVCRDGDTDGACGSSGTCEVCTAPQTCGGGGSAGVCGCIPTTCTAQNKTCGTIPDGCGGTLSCGSCPFPGQPCTNNVCGTCVPSCTGKTCGTSDDCGGTCTACSPTCLTGSCPSDQRCRDGTCAVTGRTYNCACGDSTTQSGCGPANCGGQPSADFCTALCVNHGGNTGITCLGDTGSCFV